MHSFKINSKLFLYQVNKITLNTIIIKDRIVEQININRFHTIEIKKIIIKLKNEDINIYPNFVLRIDKIIKNLYIELKNNDLDICFKKINDALNYKNNINIFKNR